MKRLTLRTASVGTFLVLLVVGCGDEDDHEHEHSGPCAEIEEVCAPRDDGTDPAVAECHELAHDGPDDECARREAECVMICGG